MEADWAAEVGPDLPSIDIPWEGFVDLREVSSVVQVVKEATDHHALRRALITMNSEASPVFSTDRKSTRLNSSHRSLSRMPSSA